ncbi:hypothetical protein [Bradyrhizobium sp.]|uniref:hypothetical protein n=1 Tax=Bradyrhizobium sp. TaxID=376 RepID=UPI003BAE981E
MSVSEHQPDLCPHCQSSFEIVYVKFGFACTSLILSCPNCAMSFAREWRAESKALDRLKTLATNTRSFWQGVAGRMDALNLRFWYVLTFLIGAVITSALLRHIIHTYGGISREGIRAGALVIIVAVALAIARKRHQH